MKYKTLLRFLEAEEDKKKDESQEEESDVMDKLPPVDIDDPRDIEEDEEDIGKQKDEVDPVTDPGTESDAEVIKLIGQAVEISKKVLHEEPILQIQSKSDLNMVGYVKHPNQNELDETYKFLTGGHEEDELAPTPAEVVGRILNHMDVNTKVYSTAFRWTDIMAKEILSIKRDLTAEEIGDLKLNFKI